MRISLNWLSDYLKINKTAKEIADKITLSLSEVEKVEKEGTDTVLEIENKALTHRPDCFSHLGIAREIAAFFNLKFSNPLDKLDRVKLKVTGKSLPLIINIKNTSLCKRYSAIVLKNIKVGESPKFIKERLLACGVRPINNIVDITNYVMLALGQPLHAFDYKKIGNHKILVRTASPDGEIIVTLDGVKRRLNEKILVIADSRKPIALAGIMGGDNSEIDSQTTTIVLESANFDPTSTRKSAKQLNLRTEASSRFEKNLDPCLTKAALVYAVTLLQKYAGTQTSSEIIDLYPVKEATKEIITSVSYLNTLLGLTLKDNQIIDLLKRLGIEVRLKNSNLIIKPSVLRRDLTIPADITEEVARIYGYDNIPTTLPKGVISPPPVNNSLYWEQNTKLLLKGIGFSEVNLPSLIGKEILELTGEDLPDYLKLINPTSPDRTYLRRSLLSGLLISTKANLRFFSEFNLFEIGRIFLKNGRGKQPTEIKTLSGILVNKAFFEAKGVVEALFDFWRISFPEINRSEANFFLPKVSAKIGDLGIIGEFNTTVKNYLGVENQISAFELDFDKIVSLSRKAAFYKQIALYPPIIEDFSFVFEKNPEIGEILTTIKKSSPLIFAVSVLDRFQKTITFRIAFQDPKRSLSSEEIHPLRKEIIRNLEDKFQAKVKGKIG